MTHKIKKPEIAILGEFDGTPYVGTLWTRNSNAVTGVVMTDSVPHFDIIAYLNGYGTRSGKDLKALVSASKPSGFTSLTCGIDSDNKFFLEGSHTFGLATTGTNPNASRDMFGFTGSETVTGSGPYRLTASGRWKRGVFQTDYDTVGGLKIATTGTATMTMSFESQDSGPASGQVTITFGNFSGGNINDLQVGGTVEAVSSGTSYTIAGFTTDSGGNRVGVIVTSGSPVDVGPAYQAVYTTGVVTDVVPSNRRVQNLVTWLRLRSFESDADDNYSNLCLEDFEAVAGNTELTYVLEEDGRVSVNYDSSQTNYGTVSSIQTVGQSLFLRLGFDGTETETTTTTNHRQIRATNRAPCVLPTGRAYVELRREVTGRDDYTIMADGSTVASGLSPIRGWFILVRVFGPAHGYSTDQERHLRAWWSYARRGLTIYPSFGDPDNAGKGGNDTRRHVDLVGLYGTTGRHTLFQTVEAEESANHHGRRIGGRLLVRRHPTDQQARREQYSGDIDIHQEIRFRVLDDPSR